MKESKEKSFSSKRGDQIFIMIWYASIFGTIVIPLSYFAISYFFFQTYVFSMWYVSIGIVVIPFLIVIAAKFVPISSLVGKHILIGAGVGLSVVGCCVNECFSTTQSSYIIADSKISYNFQAKTPKNKIFVVCKITKLDKDQGQPEKFISDEVDKHFDRVGKYLERSKLTYIEINAIRFVKCDKDAVKFVNAFSHYVWGRHMVKGGIVLLHLSCHDTKKLVAN
ncbi:hypothetical protein EDEG_04052 [Edhazardia aedis USNM 41457]|uniref:Uncharacterized protein n=1 Tax=Edhazardia aedis (strain USNM 41457) TaxID=1003232 RepID=J9DIM5_EDHAE|nr:hypothetical protein EDEG_04052 [Edhazardia aedis USNM 41457]|eukprot:EJW01217.1 hypothetical protein EDEG_04052 [Edhazardia aedis USNM 41457]